MQLDPLLTILALSLAGMAAPGPDVFLVLRLAARSRARAIAASLGIASAVAVWTTLTVSGAGLLLAAYPSLLGGIQLLGGLWLLWLSWNAGRAFLHARRERRVASAGVLDSPVTPSDPASVPASGDAQDASASTAAVSHGAGSQAQGASLSQRGFAETSMGAYTYGVVTNLSNPKAVLFFASVVAPLLPAHAPWWVGAVYAAAIVVESATFFILLALVVSAGQVRRRTLGAAGLLDLIAAAVFGMVGAALVVEGLATLVG